RGGDDAAVRVAPVADPEPYVGREAAAGGDADRARSGNAAAGRQIAGQCADGRRVVRHHDLRAYVVDGNAGGGGDETRARRGQGAADGRCTECAAHLDVDVRAAAEREAGRGQLRRQEGERHAAREIERQR